MPPVYPFKPNHLEQLAVARGYVDVDWTASEFDGWLLCPEHALNSVRIYWHGNSVGSASLTEHPEVAAIYPRIPHAHRSAFRCRIEPCVLANGDVQPFSILGFTDNHPVARRDTLIFNPRIMPPVPTPPAAIIGKMQDGQDAEQYRTLGFLYYQQIRAALDRHRKSNCPLRLLDFGCGSGRVLANFALDADFTVAAGADIDADSVAWGQANLPKCELTQVSPQPPLPYADQSFDVAISLAVFAAFGPLEQEAWLAELHRVLRPDGLLMVSIQGLFSASFLHPQEFIAELRADGIMVQERYNNLQPQLGLSDYLGVYQTRFYTWKTWSRHFEILEHLVGEIGADQDLVVLRRRRCHE